MKPIPPIAQQQIGMDSGHGKSRRGERGQHHVDRFTGRMRIAHGGDRVDMNRLSVHQLKTGGRIHPGVRDDDEDGRCDSAGRDDYPRGNVHSRPKFIPAIQIQSKENRFGKKRKAFKSKQRTDDGSRPLHERRPQ